MSAGTSLSVCTVLKDSASSFDAIVLGRSSAEHRYHVCKQGRCEQESVSRSPGTPRADCCVARYGLSHNDTTTLPLLLSTVPLPRKQATATLTQRVHTQETSPGAARHYRLRGGVVQSDGARARAKRLLCEPTSVPDAPSDPRAQVRRPLNQGSRFSQVFSSQTQKVLDFFGSLVQVSLHDTRRL